MKKKFIILAGIILLLIAGTSLAAFLDVYVKIQGLAETSAPEFYIGSAVEETLLINEEPSNCAHFSLQDSFTRVFKTEGNLGGIDFGYIPKARFSIRAKMNATTTPQDLTLKFGYINMSNVATTICFTDVSLINQMDNYVTEFINCSGKPINVKQFYYELSGNCDDCKYVIGKCAGGFYSKVELGK